MALPAYSAHAIPYRWMIREQLDDVLARREVAYRPELEDEVDQLMGMTWAGIWAMQGTTRQPIESVAWHPSGPHHCRRAREQGGAYAGRTKPS